jgi:DinB superfamily
MMDLILPVFNLNLWYSQKLVADLTDEQMCAQPVEGVVMNHPAFLLGHLALVAGNFATGFVDAAPVCPEEWKELFNQGAKPLADRSRYPSKAVLLQKLEEAHSRLADAVTKAAPEVLAQPAPEKMRARFPTVGALLAGMMTAHEGSHNGQLSAWRRAMGLPSVF